jgi:predicted phage terminase large subunit-like protein
MKPFSIFDPLLFDGRLLNPKVHAALMLMQVEEHWKHLEGDYADLEQSLVAYARAAWPLIEPNTPLVWGWHLDAICEHLESVTSGEIHNLVITVPPRSGKSSIISVMWPTWQWIRAPQTRWLFTSYAQSLSTRDALRSRRIIQSAWYQQRWGHRFHLTGDQNQKMRYDNDKTGYRIASSVGGSNTGEGGDILVTDDPHNLEDIHSDTVREGVLTWWDEVMASRLNDPKSGTRVIIQQRAHERDLAGHVLEQGGYVHLNLPMEYTSTSYSFHGKIVDPRTELGELLCPERIGPAENADLKVRLGMAAYSGQYNQQPSPAGGGVFKEWWWRYWHFPEQPLPPVIMKNAVGETVMISAIPLPEQFDEQLQSWDLAFKNLDSSDFVAGGLWARKGAQKFLLDMSHGRLDFVQTCAAIITMTQKWPQATAKLVEDTANGPAVINSLRQKVTGLIPVKPDGSKYARAMAVSPEIEAGNVFLPHPMLYPWVDPFMHEHTSFPTGAYDDRVDQTTQALNRWVSAWRVRSSKIGGI